MTSPEPSSSTLRAETAQGAASSSSSRKRNDETAEDGTSEGDGKASSSSAQKSVSQRQEIFEESDASTSSTQAANDEKAPQAEGHPWQAAHNAYYFWNSQTNTTTWVNPLQEEGSSSASGAASNPRASTSAVPQQQQQQQQPEMLSEEDLARQAGIDPELAHLDPALYASQLRMAASSAASSGSASLAADRDPQSRFSQTSKAKRQMSAYFDVEAWEQQREAEHAAQVQALADESGAGYAGVKRGKGNRHPSKKEVQEFKERKRERKKAKLGWLHS
ncbi:hypothetical protein BCV69DRAFT_121956 [Microstroma glucosiphilum]|uniref:WW domain-containing protein n=1 Tax=Pseudomicrostroma glucosiphilum TaxID=1684307 RepID=A0A316TWA0_9BASI|nr:hypothetical protein BCV69DRAFT_121956 [Pseudomicrostroma glucosiphilum]PWN17782.1 hypothetical protein BCV69DRAFT_121956 [Pseudomicrostroma glucosiphilum]